MAQRSIILKQDFAIHKEGDTIAMCSMFASDLVRSGVAEYISVTPPPAKVEKQADAAPETTVKNIKNKKVK